MKEITKYVSDDGKEFETKEDCIKHERELEDVIPHAIALRDFCNSMGDSCSGCPFDNTDVLCPVGTPGNWNFDFLDQGTQNATDYSTDAPIYRGLPEYDD